MLKVFYKENLNKLVDESGLSEREVNLINKCKEAFNYEIRVLEIKMDPYFSSSTVTLERQFEYMQLSSLIDDTYVECKKLISDMEKTGEYNYKALDLILYNSMNVYIHTSDYGIKTSDEFVLPVAQFILSKFGHNLNSSNFPISYRYFMESVDNVVDRYDEECHLLLLVPSQVMGKILKFRENKTKLKRCDIIDFLESVLWLKKHTINLDFSITDLKLIDSFDFSKFKYSDLNTVINILNIMFNKYNLFNEYDTSALDSLEVELTEAVVKNVFNYLSECASFLKENKDSHSSMPVDEYNSCDKLVIELIFNDIKRDCICRFYDEKEFESCVNNVLEEILEVAYYREYKRSIDMVKSKLLSKSDLEMEIPF